MLAYLSLIEKVYRHGTDVPSRFGPTREFVGLQVRTDPTRLVHRSGINYRLGWMELLQLLAGVYDPDRIAAVAPKADLSLFTAQAAYGPRTVDKLPRIVSALAADPDTRQAVLYFGEDRESCTADHPCTVTYQFLHRGGKLHGLVSMRSWDLIKGLVYDLIMFGGLLQAVAACLHVIEGAWVFAGDLVVTAGSGHVYESDAGKIPTNRTAHFYVHRPAKPADWTLMYPEDRLDAFRTWARGQVYAEWPSGTPEGIRVSDPHNVMRRSRQKEVPSGTGNG